MNATDSLDKYGKNPALISLEELRTWIIHEDEHLLVLNKPGWVVCHPSKNGPLSSLVGACREYTGLDRLHLVSRLDRETSGLVVLAKHRKSARLCQMAFQNRTVDKRYLAILSGELKQPCQIDQPLARDGNSLVHVKQTVRDSRSAQKAVTDFMPLRASNGFTLAQVIPHTGRKHQIRAHALWMGIPLIGDKIYGPDETLYLDFIETGWTEEMAQQLLLPRQALHAAQLTIRTEEDTHAFSAPLAPDMQDFCAVKMGIEPTTLHEILPVW